MPVGIFVFGATAQVFTKNALQVQVQHFIVSIIDAHKRIDILEGRL
jgi:hypothetical protein